MDPHKPQISQSSVQLTDSKIDEIVNDDTNNTYVYGWKEGKQLAYVMPMSEVSKRVDQCVSLGTPGACMAVEELADFSKTHPRIFAAVTSGDRKRIRLVRAMIETKASCESATAEQQDVAMTDLHLRWMGFDRSSRRRMMRNFDKAKSSGTQGRLAPRSK